jgi:hypothetical protein
MTYTIHWETRCVAANPRVNPNAEDRNTVWCVGFSAIVARNRDEAIDCFQKAFPTDRILAIN